MTSIRRHKVLLDQSAAVTTDWYKLDTRYDSLNDRVLQLDITTGDTIEIQGTTQDVRGPDKSFLASLAADDISTITSKTADEAVTIPGNWSYIRVVKTGATGNAKVQGYI
jgi:hypothetical protein